MSPQDAKDYDERKERVKGLKVQGLTHVMSLTCSAW